MKRYFTLQRRPSSWDDYHAGSSNTPPNLTVYDRERVPRETGLLDSNGHKIMTDDAPEPIGFLAKSQTKD